MGSGIEHPTYTHQTGTDQSKTGDAANITAQISKDAAASAATDDTNPTELDATNHLGVYLFTLTQADSNADLVVLTASSNVSIEPVFIYTKPQLAAITFTFTYTLTSTSAHPRPPRLGHIRRRRQHHHHRPAPSHPCLVALG